MFQSSVEVTLT